MKEPKDFVSISESLWKGWLGKTLDLSPLFYDKFLMEYLPEPYLVFGNSDAPLYVLTTNPGGGMDEQHRKAVNGSSPLASTNLSYRKNAAKLASFYRAKLVGTAQRRIKGFLGLAKATGHSGVWQFETCPFHSKVLPMGTKKKLIALSATDEWYARYIAELGKVLEGANVLTLSAVGTRNDISVNSILANPWLNWQAKLMGFNTEDCVVLELSKNDKRATSAFVYSQGPNGTKGFLLMMGGNHLPSQENMEAVVEVIGKRFV